MPPIGVQHGPQRKNLTPRRQARVQATPKQADLQARKERRRVRAHPGQEQTASKEVGPPLVLIEWDDSARDADWLLIEDEDEGKDYQHVRCRSVGWLIHDGDQTKIVCPHVGNGFEQGCGRMKIPALAIRRIVLLKG